MKTAPAVAAIVVISLTGCGGRPRVQPGHPHLPGPLAREWRARADRIAASLAAGEGCAAKEGAVALRARVIAAVNAHRIPDALLEGLTSAVNGLPERIACTQPAPGDATAEQQARNLSAWLARYSR